MTVTDTRYQRFYQTRRTRRVQWFRRVREQHGTCQICGAPAGVLAPRHPERTTFTVNAAQLNRRSDILLAVLADSTPLCLECHATIDAVQRQALPAIDLATVEAPPW